MPTFPPALEAPRFTGLNYSVSFLAAGGDGSTTTIAELPNTVSGAELATLRDALGGLSNAAIIREQNASFTRIDVTQAVVFDEAYSSVNNRAVFVFQNASGDVRTISIPAPDITIFGPDGVTINPAEVTAAVSQLTLVLNGGALGSGTYSYVRGYRQSTSRKLNRGKYQPTISEPGVGDEPGPEPGI